MPTHMRSAQELVIIGGGLAGSEAAWQAAQRGLHVRLYEMRPATMTGAHQTADLAELVCSNSLGSNLPDRASGVLKRDLRCLGSMLLECAQAAALPAGSALAYRFQTTELGREIRYYSTSACSRCALKPRCTCNPGKPPYHSLGG